MLGTLADASEELDALRRCKDAGELRLDNRAVGTALEKQAGRQWLFLHGNLPADRQEV